MSTENSLTKTYSGIFGNQVVLKNRKGKSIMVIPKTRDKVNPTAKQVEVRKKFALASQYARTILLIPEMKALYAAKAVNGSSAYVVAMTDWLNPPAVHEIDTLDYKGNPGDKIHVVALDNFALKEVRVSVFDSKGSEIEKGFCDQDPMTSRFDYIATVRVDNLKGVKIIAHAVDFPNHIGELSKTL
ncbi:MAG: hypothetical protein ACOYNC_13830 [Bacteroidales bacterium]